ncbi:hypothetical protein [Streptosporangium lutulentum]|uniref:Uncharacterized protein n=1 Tax=Streptosporangium lutulentum TaxID=1461250 RepID=A0ABT9QLZ3_9ACTN|nr:hypothetical protein [Streptosporangium lutulentum]MDP9847416.1 hypothetical protein [Streptosporangium lutulentum]
MGISRESGSSSPPPVRLIREILSLRPFIRPDYLGPIYMIAFVSAAVILIKVLT